MSELEKNCTPITVGIIGAGTFGSQIISQICHAKGMRASAVADLKPERATHALNLGKIANEEMVSAETAEDINDAIDQGRPAVTSNAEELIRSKVEIIVEVTGNGHIGAKYGFNAIMAKKHIVMVTVEADILVGYLLKHLADNAGVIYSAAYGDEPSLAFELYDWAKTLGFRVIAAGKGTRFTTDFRKANPDDVPRLYGFTGEDYNAQIFCSFLDGTKHAIEMTALSNMTGLVPDVRGMHFPTVELEEIPERLALKAKGGILEREGVVEVISAIHPDQSFVKRSLRGGMYAVIEGETPFPVESLESYGDILGMVIGKKSRQAMIYRPQHFVGHEVPIGIARIALDGQPSGAPIGRFSECVAAAKKNLKPGTILDGEGGYTVYGIIERAETAKSENLVPMGLTQGAEVIEEIPEDGMITHDNVRLPESFALNFRRIQDSLD
jgi:predicted homoserine dehydrogenase-like protein